MDRRPGAADINPAAVMHRGHDFNRYRMRLDDSTDRFQIRLDRDVGRSGAAASVLDGGKRRIPDCNVGNQKDALKSDLLSIL